MAKKPRPDAWYQAVVDQHTPKKPLFRNFLVAFCSGGLLCALAETARFVLTHNGVGDKPAANIVLICVILLTGVGVYDRAGQALGAGLAVPISGFANSVAASMLEYKYEGLVLGSGCNSFKLAGAVVVFGIASAFLLTLSGWMLGLI